MPRRCHAPQQDSRCHLGALTRYSVADEIKQFTLVSKREIADHSAGQWGIVVPGTR
jgi:hypothetical protein